MALLLKASEVRGRDGFGWQAFSAIRKSALRLGGKSIPHDNQPVQFDTSHYQSLLTTVATEYEVFGFMSNHRAEPTTEFIETKQVADQQPYEYRGLWCVHNGTIANDKAILRDINPPTSVDSYAIPVFVHKNGLRENLWRGLVGSYAMLLWNENGGVLAAARNYNPLNILWCADEKMWVFSSIDATPYFPSAQVIPFPPYSTAHWFDERGGCRTYTHSPANRQRALVVCSGGLDSVTAAKVAQERGCEVILLHFCYGCQAETREMQAVRDVAKALSCQHRFVDASWLKVLGGSSLTEDGHIADGISGAEFCHEWVPARNTAMIGIAAAYADRLDCGSIFLGLNLEESGAYCDNTVEFYEKYNAVLDVGTQARPTIVNPLATLTKKEIVDLAYEIGAPIHLAWSCYRGGAKHCGICGPCHMRRVAHKMLNRMDSIDYEYPMR